GDELKQRIESNDFPLFPGPGPFGFGMEHHMHGLPVAAKYLGLTEAQLDSKLESGKTLAQVAKDQGKSVDGLVAAMKADLKQKLDRAVSDGRMTKSDENKALSDADQRLKNFVNGKLIRPVRPDGWFGHRDEFGARPGTGYQGPPAA